MARNDFTVLLDLQEFFSDDRRRSKVLINQNYTKIIDLEDKISEIFGIERFHLLSDGHFLPSCEDIALIRNGETICVKPTLSPLPSVLLSDIYYKNHTNSCNEIKRISDDGLSQVTLQPGTVPLEKPTHQFCNETVVSTSCDKKLEYCIKNKNDHLRPKFYASTPNTENISPEYNERHESEELVEIHKNKKKKKHKLERNENVSRKRKCKVLEEDKTLDMSIENNCDFERKSKGKAKRKKTMKKELDAENNSLQKENDELIDSSNKEVSIREPKTTHHENLVEVESKINEHPNIDLKPLPHKKAREGKTWSTEPLLKTINIVKIIKTPISKIEIDYSRFDFIPYEDYPMDNPLNEIKNVNKNFPGTNCNGQKSSIVKQNNSECSVSSEHNAEGTAAIKFQSGSKTSPKKICENINLDVGVETNEISSTSHVTASNKNENLELPALLENNSSFGSDRIQLNDNSQDSEHESKNKARELWRQKINKISEDSKSLESCSSSALYNNFVKANILFEDKNNQLDTEIVDEIDTNKDIGMVQAEFEEITTKEVPDSAVHTEEDSLLSFTTVTDTGNDSEPKKKRRRRHRKKNKNEISTKPCWEENSNNFIAKNVPLVSAKPKIHVRFEDSDNEILEQNKIQPEAHDIEEKIKIFQNVTLTPDKFSGGENEIHVEEKRNIEPNTDSPNHEAASSKSPSSSNSTQEKCIPMVLQAPISKFFNEKIETLKQYHKDHSNSSNCNLKDEEEIDMALLKLKTELLKTVDAMDRSIKTRDILTGHSQSF